MTATHHIKVRRVGARKWAFLTSRGGTNFLRIHAAEFDAESAARIAAEIANENTTDTLEQWEAKAVTI